MSEPDYHECEYKERLDKLCDAAESLSEDNLKLKARLAEAERTIVHAITQAAPGDSRGILCQYFGHAYDTQEAVEQARRLWTADSAGACICPSALGGPHPGCPVHGRAVCDL